MHRERILPPTPHPPAAVGGPSAPGTADLVPLTSQMKPETGHTCVLRAAGPRAHARPSVLGLTPVFLARCHLVGTAHLLAFSASSRWVSSKLPPRRPQEARSPRTFTRLRLVSVFRVVLTTVATTAVRSGPCARQSGGHGTKPGLSLQI